MGLKPKPKPASVVNTANVQNLQFSAQEVQAFLASDLGSALASKMFSHGVPLPAPIELETPDGSSYYQAQALLEAWNTLPWLATQVKGFSQTAAKGPGAPGWCEHHKQNHHKNTKCPFMTGGGVSEVPPEETKPTQSAAFAEKAKVLSAIYAPLSKYDWNGHLVETVKAVTDFLTSTEGHTLVNGDGLEFEDLANFLSEPLGESLEFGSALVDTLLAAGLLKSSAGLVTATPALAGPVAKWKNAIEAEDAEVATSTKPEAPPEPVGKSLDKLTTAEKQAVADQVFTNITKGWNPTYPDAIKKKITWLLTKSNALLSDDTLSKNQWVDEISNQTGNTTLFCQKLVNAFIDVGILVPDKLNGLKVNKHIEVSDSADTTKPKTNQLDKSSLTKANPHYLNSTKPESWLLESLVASPPPWPLDKIDLIKRVRNYTWCFQTSYQLGLKEAKDLVEAAIAAGLFQQTDVAHSSYPKFTLKPLAPDVAKQISANVKQPKPKPDPIQTPSDAPQSNTPAPFTTYETTKKSVPNATKTNLKSQAIADFGWNTNGKGSKVLDTLLSGGQHTVDSLLKKLSADGTTTTKGVVVSIVDDLISKGYAKLQDGKIRAAELKSKPWLNQPQQLPKKGKGLHVAPVQPKLTGKTPKTVYQDADGQTFLFKQGEPNSQAADKASKVFQKLLPEFAIKVEATKIDNIVGSVQPYMDADAPPAVDKMSPAQRRSLQQQQVVDWLIGNYDNKPDNFILVGDKVLGIDKDQSFKDYELVPALEVEQKHTGSGSIYKQLNQFFKDNPKELDPSAYQDVVKKISNLSDEEWTQLVPPSALESAKARKQSIKADFEKLVSELKGEPTQLGTTSPQEAPAVLPVPEGGKKVLPSAELPSVAELKHEGSGAHLGGAKPKDIYSDKSGKKYLFKPAAEPWRRAVQQAVSDLSSMIVSPAEFVPVKADHAGTLQPLVPNATPLIGKAPKSLTPAQKSGVQRERLLDWVFGNHDSHGNNMILSGDTVLGVDKEQAFKHLGSDKLDVDYHPNAEFGEKPPYYNQFYKDYADKKIDLNLNELLPYIKKIESIPDSTWETVVQPYVEGLAKDTPNAGVKWKQKLTKQILERKNNVRKDFEQFFSELRKKRGEGPFKFGE
jgi:hypothetical protein